MEIIARLANLPGALPGACAQGLIWGIMAIGVYLTYRILDVADLTVDGSFGTGGAVCVMCLLSGQNVWVSLLMALLAGLLDGTIDMIATDHAPHSAEEKAKGLRGSAMGVVGIETVFPLLYTYLVETGKMPLEMLIDRMADAPRRRFRIDGGMQVGDKAAVTVFDLHAQEKIDPNTFLSKGHATPFEGWEVHAACRLTVCGDKIAYNALSRKE